MSDVVNSPNMGLPVPIVGVDPGPQYATDTNNCFSLIDQHDHTSGNGVPITPLGLNINTDLSMASNSLTLIRSTRFNPQNSPLAAATDLGCAYVSGVDLYYNDVNGNQIRLTQSGSIVGTSGSISGLVSPASASYVAGSSTFVWQSAVNTPANLDAAAIILRNLTASSKGLTLSPPAAMGSNFSITLPVLPASNQSFMIMSTSGDISATFTPDNSSIEFGGSVLRVKAGGITKGMLDAQATNYAIQAKTANYTILTTDGYVAGDASGGAFAFTLPNPVGVSGRQLVIERTDDTPTNGITLTGTIEGETDWVLYTKGESVSLVSNNVEWKCVNHKTLTKLSAGAAITITGSTSNPTKGTTSLDEVRWFRSGQHAYCYYRYIQTGAGVAGSGFYLLTLPNSFVVDTTYISINTDTDYERGSVLGLVEGVYNMGIPSSSSNFIIGYPSLYTNTKIRLVGVTGFNSGVFWASTSISFGNASFNANCWLKVPIVGWKA